MIFYSFCVWFLEMFDRLLLDWQWKTASQKNRQKKINCLVMVSIIWFPAQYSVDPTLWQTTSKISGIIFTDWHTIKRTEIKTSVMAKLISCLLLNFGSWVLDWISSTTSIPFTFIRMSGIFSSRSSCTWKHNKCHE